MTWQHHSTIRLRISFSFFFFSSSQVGCVGPATVGIVKRHFSLFIFSTLTNSATYGGHVEKRKRKLAREHDISCIVSYSRWLTDLTRFTDALLVPYRKLLFLSLHFRATYGRDVGRSGKVTCKQLTRARRTRHWFSLLCQVFTCIFSLFFSISMGRRGR